MGAIPPIFSLMRTLLSWLGMMGMSNEAPSNWLKTSNQQIGEEAVLVYCPFEWITISNL